MKRSLRCVGLVLVAGAFVVVTGCSLFNSPPVANFTWSPVEPLARVEVEFTDASTDDGGLFGGGGVVSWNWDFDDGDSSTTQNPTHEFTKSGDYGVTLTVTDASGSSKSVTKTVRVSPSLDGRWSGTITDLAYNQWSLTLDLNHTSSGGISGTVTIPPATEPITSASLDSETGEVSIHCAVYDMILRGELNAAENRISGKWFDDDTGDEMESWSVTLE